MFPIDGWIFPCQDCRLPTGSTNSKNIYICKACQSRKGMKYRKGGYQVKVKKKRGYKTGCLVS